MGNSEAFERVGEWSPNKSSVKMEDFTEYEVVESLRGGVWSSGDFPVSRRTNNRSKELGRN